MSNDKKVFGCRRCGGSFEGAESELGTATCNCVPRSPVWVEVPPYRPGIDELYQMPDIPES